jgi:hypothetical protein
MNRKEVYERIDQEREYQRLRWGIDLPETGELLKPTESFLLYIQHHLNKAIAEISSTPTDKEALNEVRKIAALAVACLEQHGCDERDLSNVVNRRS